MGTEGGKGSDRVHPPVVHPAWSAGTTPSGVESGAFRDAYHFLLTTSWLRLVTILMVAYLAGNALFAVAYWLQPGSLENARPGSFADAFFFSVDTMATIGYGNVAPRTLLANMIVTVESFVGLLYLALMTGLIFAKFSRPTARVLFSRVAILGRRDGVPSLMFRMANARESYIVEAEVHVVLARDEETAEGEAVRRFHDLGLVRRRNAIFAYSWTVVHPIDAASPLHGATADSLRAARAEVVVSMIGFDETFAQSVHARHGYAADELRWNVRFVDVVHERPDGRPSIDFAHFHDVEPEMAAKPRVD